jgi:hypothetical protein
VLCAASAALCCARCRLARSARSPCRARKIASSAVSSTTPADISSAARPDRCTKPAKSSSGAVSSTTQSRIPSPSTGAARTIWRLPSSSKTARTCGLSRAMSKARVSTGSPNSSARRCTRVSPSCFTMRLPSRAAISPPARSMITAWPLRPMRSAATKSDSAASVTSMPTTATGRPSEPATASEAVMPGRRSVKKI